MALSTPKQRAGCCGFWGGANADAELGGPSEDSRERGIAEQEGFDKTMSWLKRNFKSARAQPAREPALEPAATPPGADTMRRNFWHGGVRASFKSFRSGFDIRSHAETVVQALSTRRVYLLRYVRYAGVWEGKSQRGAGEAAVGPCCLSRW